MSNRHPADPRFDVDLLLRQVEEMQRPRPELEELHRALHESKPGQPCLKEVAALLWRDRGEDPHRS